MTSDALTPLRVGFDMSAAVVGRPGVQRYTADVALAQAGLPSIELTRLGVKPCDRRAHARRSRARERLRAHTPGRLGREAAAADVDVLHYPAALTLPHARMPLVLTVHDVLPWRRPELFRATEGARRRAVVSHVASAASRVLVGSEHTRGEVVELLGLDPRRVMVAPLGVDRRFRPIEPDPVALAHRFGIPPDPFVLWVGTLEPRKNLLVLLRAFGLVRRRAPECSLVIVGNVPGDNRDVEREMDLLGAHIIRPGIVSDDELVQLYSSTTCFVFPSLYEGFGLPPLEAMACGAPVVCSNRASLPEVVGDAGILVDSTDPDALADAIEEVVLSPSTANDMRDRGLARARGFTWKRCAEHAVDAYRAALEDPR